MEINILVAAVILLKAAIPFSQHPPLASQVARGGYGLNRSSCCQLKSLPPEARRGK